MSFPEVLFAVRALPPGERLRLLHALVDDLSVQPPLDYTRPILDRHQVHLPDGIPADDTSPEVELLRKVFGTAGVPPQASPVFAPEAAAALAQMLEAEKPRE